MSFQENSPVHTPRPPNAFFCFRSWFVRKQKEAAHTASGPKGSYMRDISRQAAQRWNSMSDEEKQPYFDMALRMRDEHKVAYPDYKFAPAKRGSKSLVQRAGPSHRPARTTKGHQGPESAPSFTSGSFDGGSPSRLTPTPSSPSTPPLDRLYRAHDSSYISSGLGKGPNESFQRRSDRRDPWNRLPTQPFGTFDTSRDPIFISHDSGSYSPYGLEAAYSSFEQTAQFELFEPQEDFRAFCQWDDDFSGYNTGGSASSSTYYRSY